MNKYARVPDYIVDLHGHTTREAGEVLDSAIKSGEHKHIRVITGKGTFRETGPVMRNFVKRYLQENNIKFETSKISDGGDGALEVYLEY
jgi:DNA-nicking Smr family endonuclease